MLMFIHASFDVIGVSRLQGPYVYNSIKKGECARRAYPLSKPEAVLTLSGKLTAPLLLMEVLHAGGG